MKKLLLAVTLFSASAFAKNLDGKVFTIESAEKGKTNTEKEDVDFTKGKFHSQACDRYGFEAGSYTLNGDKFEADTTSAKEGKIHWSGTVSGDHIDGTYLWSKSGQKPIEYWFKGTLKK
jgi:hypothetical protein